MATLHLQRIPRSVASLGILLLILCAATRATDRAEGYDLKEVGRIELPGREEAVADLSPGGQAFVAAIDGTARVYDARTLAPLTPELPHGQPIASVRFDRGASRVLTVGKAYARVWDATTGRRLSARMHHGPKTEIAFAELSPDGRRLLTVAAEPPDPGPPGIRVTPVNAPAPEVTAEQGEVRVWDVQTGEQVYGLPHPTFVQCATFSPDGRRILTASTFLVGEAYLWDAADGRRIGDPLKDVVTGSTIAAFSADGRRFALNCWYEVRVHAADTGKRLRAIAECAYHALPTSVAISPDGKVVYMTDQSTDARSWDVDTGGQIARPMKDLLFLTEVRFSANGTRMFAPGYDFEGAGVWDGRGKRLWAPEDDAGPVTSVAFLPDGTITLLSARHGGVRVYRLEPKR